MIKSILAAAAALALSFGVMVAPASAQVKCKSGYVVKTTLDFDYPDGRPAVGKPLVVIAQECALGQKPYFVLTGVVSGKHDSKEAIEDIVLAMMKFNAIKAAYNFTGSEMDNMVFQIARLQKESQAATAPLKTPQEEGTQTTKKP